MSAAALSSSPARDDARWAGLALALLLALSILPVALTDIPAMVDYPNHLARMSVLARAGTAAAHPHFDVAWAPYPNLAMDALVPPLARLVGVALATKLFLVASQLLVVGGAMALSYVVQRRMLLAGLVACLFLYAMPFAFGFLNFQFALGLALLALASWIGLGERQLALRLAVHALAVAILYFAHLFALGLYGFAIGIIELWRLRYAPRPAAGPLAALWLGMAAPALAVAALATAAGGSVGGKGTVWSAESKLFWLGMLNGWSREYATIAAGLLLVPLLLAWRRGYWALLGPGNWLAIAFGLLFVAMPFRLFDTGYVDGRVLLAAILILPAFARFDLPGGWKRAMLGLAVALCLANAALAAYAQSIYRSEYKALLSAFEAMPRGARLLPAESGNGDGTPANLLDFPRIHAATLAVHSRDAFVPTLFAFPGKQPLLAKPSVQHIKLLEGGPIPWRILEIYASGHAPPEPVPYVADWTRDFDYLLLIDPPAIGPRLDILEPVASGPHFGLYRIRTRRRP
jgi:hypothetical protein